jgi:hypothetical protein
MFKDGFLQQFISGFQVSERGLHGMGRAGAAQSVI